MAARASFGLVNAVGKALPKRTFVDRVAPVNRRRVMAWALRLLGPALMLVVIVRMPDRKAIWEALTSAKLGLLGLAVALNAVNLQLKVARWVLFLKTQGQVYPIRRAWAAYLSSSYVGMLTPGRVGDVLRVQYLRHDLGMSYADGLATVVMDRFCDLYVLVAFTAVGVVRFGPLVSEELAQLAWAGVVITLIVPLVFFIPGLAETFVRIVYAKVAKRSEVETGFDQFLKSLRAHAGKTLVVTVPMTVAAFLVNYAQGYYLARAIYLEISFFDITCLMAIASLLGLMPISISGMGVRELFFALIFPALGLAASAGISFGLLVFAVLYLCLVAVGFVSFQWAPPPMGGDPHENNQNNINTIK